MEEEETEAQEIQEEGREEQREAQKRRQESSSPPSYARRSTDQTVDCPNCLLSVRADKLESHRWRAHNEGVERRTQPVQEEEDADKPSTPPRKTEKKTDKQPESASAENARRRWFDWPMEGSG